jgi:3D (Asp-Asp-Asp) domain-containing protein
MRRRLTILAALAALSAPLAAYAQDGVQGARDPIGDLINNAIAAVTQAAEAVMMKATLYHTGAAGVGSRDSLGCKVVAMRTAAIGAANIPLHTLVFIKETVGLPLPGGGVHDGYWYASDTGGAIKGARIDLFTGNGRASMAALAKLNQAVLTVQPVGKFDGCPKA